MSMRGIELSLLYSTDDTLAVEITWTIQSQRDYFESAHSLKYHRMKAKDFCSFPSQDICPTICTKVIKLQPQIFFLKLRWLKKIIS